MEHQPPADPSTWLDLRSGAPGLPGPYLQEFNAPYEQFDGIADHFPHVVVVIGGKSKSRRVANSLGMHQTQRDTVSLRLWKEHKVLLVDSELHLKSHLPRILAGPSPGYYTNHCLECAVPSPSLIATRLYSEVLLPFCTFAIVFVADFCGIDNTIDMLATWLRNAILRVPNSGIKPIRILLSLDNHDSTAPTVEASWFQILTTLLRQLRIAESANPYTFSSLRKAIPHYMHLDILPELSNHDFAQALLDKLDSAAMYSARHLEFLLKAAIRHFAAHMNDTSGFDPIVASRASIALPLGWQDRVLDFVGSTEHTDLPQTALIASALMLNAFPPGMHREFGPFDFQEYLGI